MIHHRPHDPPMLSHEDRESLMGIAVLLIIVVVAICLMLMISPAFAQTTPNQTKTPGLVRDLTVGRICATKWTMTRVVRDERMVTEAMKLRVYLAYGYANGNKDPRCPCEIDHSVPRSLGGADDERNLWPESYRGAWNAHMKDRLEVRLHREVCAGKLGLKEAQREIAADWKLVYRKYYSE